MKVIFIIEYFCNSLNRESAKSLQKNTIPCYFFQTSVAAVCAVWKTEADELGVTTRSGEKSKCFFCWMNIQKLDKVNSQVLQKENCLPNPIVLRQKWTPQVHKSFPHSQLLCAVQSQVMLALNPSSRSGSLHDDQDILILNPGAPLCQPSVPGLSVPATVPPAPFFRHYYPPGSTNTSVKQIYPGPML